MTGDDATADDAHARGDTVERPAVLTRLTATEPDPPDELEQTEEHPVAVPLAGFFTGMVYVLALPVLYVWLSDPDSIADLISVDLVWGILAILVPVVLTAVPRTRKFGRYMLVGVLLSGVVVVGVTALVLAFLILTGA